MVKWDETLERKWTGGRERRPGWRLVVVHSAPRTEAEVFRAMREDYAAVGFCGIGQEPADVLLQVRPFLSDDELAVVAKALGF
jgi:hypothetical protein